LRKLDPLENFINKKILIILTMKFEISKITERGQVTIPEIFRKKYGFMGGDRVVFIEKDKGLFLRSSREVDMNDLEEMFKKTTKLKPKNNLTAEQMDILNEGMFR